MLIRIRNKNNNVEFDFTEVEELELFITTCSSADVEYALCGLWNEGERVFEKPVAANQPDIDCDSNGLKLYVDMPFSGPIGKITRLLKASAFVRTFAKE